MQFKPTQKEQNSLENMSQTNRMHYFLTRTMEAEEIWSLGDSAGWLLRKDDNKSILQVWPYTQLAENYSAFHQNSSKASATSLENFVHNVLGTMIEQNIEVEILPIGSNPGQRLHARELHELFHSMLESGEYNMEG